MFTDPLLILAGQGSLGTLLEFVADRKCFANQTSCPAWVELAGFRLMGGGYLYLTCGMKDMQDRYFIGDLSFTLMAFCQDKLASPVTNVIGILSGLMQVLSPTFMASCQDWLASDTTNIHGNQLGQFLSPTLLALCHHRFASPVTHFNWHPVTTE